MRRHATKSQASVATAGYIVMCKLDGTLGQLVPDGIGDGQWGRILYNRIGACMARPSGSVTLFETYEQARAAIAKTVRNARRHFLKQGLRTENYPKWCDKNAFMIFCVGRYE